MEMDSQVQVVPASARQSQVANSTDINNSSATVEDPVPEVITLDDDHDYKGSEPKISPVTVTQVPVVIGVDNTGKVKWLQRQRPPMATSTPLPPRPRPVPLNGLPPTRLFHYRQGSSAKDSCQQIPKSVSPPMPPQQQQQDQQPGPSNKKVCRRNYVGSLVDEDLLTLLVPKYTTISTCKEERRKSMALYGHPEWEPPPTHYQEVGAEVEVSSPESDKEAEVKLDLGLELQLGLPDPEGLNTVDEEVKAELSASFEARLKTLDPKREKRQAELKRTRETFASQRQLAWNVRTNNEQLANRIILARERMDGFVAESAVLNKEAELLLKMMCQCFPPGDMGSVKKLMDMCQGILKRGSSG